MGVLPEGPDAWEGIVVKPTSQSAQSAQEAKKADDLAKSEPRLVRVAAAHFQVGSDAGSAVAACKKAMEMARAMRLCRCGADGCRSVRRLGVQLRKSRYCHPKYHPPPL